MTPLHFVVRCQVSGDSHGCTGPLCNVDRGYDHSGSTVKDLTSKESAKRVDEWQRYIVHDLIEKNPSINFADLSRDYVSEAQPTDDCISVGHRAKPHFFCPARCGAFFIRET
jgi:hypothetical protein